MLEQIDLTKKMTKEAYQEGIDSLKERLAGLQRECRSLGIPVILVFEGLDASGKGVQINHLIHPLDPRGFQVFAIKEANEEERLHPFLWRFWTKIPEKGRIAIFDTSWYRRLSTERFEKNFPEKEFLHTCEEINSFERTLTDDGNVLIKFFLYISQKEQRKRFDKMLGSKETAWKVSRQDEKRNSTVMAWIGANAAAKQAAKQGMNAILSPQIPYYINRKQSKLSTEPMSQGHGTETVEAVYNYQPLKDVDADLQPYYKGVQANFWTEWVTEPSVLEYLMLPRLAAVAEAGWTPQEKRNYEDFKERIRKDAELYDLKGWDYGKHIMK